MSGHSKWHNIQARKGKQDARRGNEFTRLAKGITVAAQKGGDPATNFSLRIAIEKAKAVSMPKDNIERAIKRGTGEDGAENRMEEVLYEAYGPSGVALLIKAVTDNKNRTLSDVKQILLKNSGSLGGSGSVQWLFGQWAIVTITKEQLLINKLDHQEMELKLIDVGVEDMQDGEAGLIDIRARVENFKKVLDLLREYNIEVKESGVQWIAKDTIPITKEVEDKLADLFNDLEANDDVADYFTNAA